MKASDNVQFNDSLFTVSTMTKWLFVSKPHSVVIPHILHGRPTAARGFRVEYATSDPAILERWHKMLCSKLSEGLFDLMLQNAHQGLFPLLEDERELIHYVVGFRC